MTTISLFVLEANFKICINSGNVKREIKTKLCSSSLFQDVGRGKLKFNRTNRKLMNGFSQGVSIKFSLVIPSGSVMNHTTEAKNTIRFNFNMKKNGTRRTIFQFYKKLKNKTILIRY